MTKTDDAVDDADDCSSSKGSSFLTFGRSSSVDGNGTTGTVTPDSATPAVTSSLPVTVVQFLAHKKHQYDSYRGLEVGRDSRSKQEQEKHQQERPTRTVPPTPEEVVAKLKQVQARAKPTTKDTKRKGATNTSIASQPRPPSPQKERLTVIKTVKPNSKAANGKTKPSKSTATPVVKITATALSGSKTSSITGATRLTNHPYIKVQAARDLKPFSTPPHGQAVGTTVLRRTDLASTNNSRKEVVKLEHKIHGSTTESSSEAAVKKQRRRQLKNETTFHYVHYSENQAADDKRVFCPGDILLPPPSTDPNSNNDTDNHSLLSENIYIQGDPNLDNYLEIVGFPGRDRTPRSSAAVAKDDDPETLPQSVVALSCMRPRRLVFTNKGEDYPDGRSDDVFEDEEQQRQQHGTLSNQCHRPILPIQVLCTRSDQVQDVGTSCLAPALADSSNVSSYPNRSLRSAVIDNNNMDSSDMYCHFGVETANTPTKDLPSGGPHSPTATMASCNSTQHQDLPQPTKSGRRCRRPKCGLTFIFGVSLLLFLFALLILIAWYVIGYVVRGGTTTNSAAALANSGDIPSADGLYQAVSLQDFPAETQILLDSQDSSLGVAHAYKWLINDPYIRQYPKWRQLQRFALATLFYSTNGIGWEATEAEQWLNYEVSECQWLPSSIKACDGDILDEENTQVLRNERQGALSTGQKASRLRRLVLSGKNLEGTLPPELLSLLPSLKHLVLSDNPKLIGTLPTAVGQLSQLELLWASQCSFSGIIPTELGLLTSLQSLDLSRNALGMGVDAATNSSTSSANQQAQVSSHISHHDGSGAVSSSSSGGNYRFSTDFRQTDKGSASDIPSELGFLTLLTDLALSHNHLANSLPTELGKLTQLRLMLDVEDNQLTGTLPTELGALTELERLYVGKNAFLGSLPSEIGNLQQLVVLDASSNHFTGPIPMTFVFWPSGGSLQELWLYENDLTGQIPIFLPRSIRDLDLSLNRFDGTIPSQLSSMTNLEGLWLYVNNLSGAIPSDLGNLQTSLTQLSLFGNRLDSTIPTELGRLSLLTGLWLNENVLTGSLPTQLGALSLVRQFDFHSNQLQGPILSSFGQLTALEKLELQNNQFSGIIPAGFKNLKSLKELKLDTNYLIIGPIPSGLGALTALTSLTLGDTSLSGSVPAELCELKQSSLDGLTISIDCLNVDCECDCKCSR